MAKSAISRQFREVVPVPEQGGTGTICPLVVRVPRQSSTGTTHQNQSGTGTKKMW